MTFESLGLSAEILRAVSKQGYSEPTPIQAQAIPVVLTGKDLLGGAQTGKPATHDGLHITVDQPCSKQLAHQQRDATGRLKVIDVPYLTMYLKGHGGQFWMQHALHS